MASRWFRLLCSLVVSLCAADSSGFGGVAFVVGGSLSAVITIGPEAYRRCDGVAVVPAVLFVG
ncbi:MAG: hypothetical protein OXE79_05050 [Acidimicrobiaceae bacterium]|nr:hypothetical protein [Acidimicrobiaceae bacterium]